MLPFEIRPAMESDIDGIFAVHRDSVVQLCTGTYTSEQIASWLEGRNPTMYLKAIRSGSLWVADDGQIQGLVETDGEELTKLFVRGDRAHSGIGKALLDKAVAAIAQGGHARVYLESTTNASSFYERHGFAVIGNGTFSHGRSPIQLEILKMERRL